MSTDGIIINMVVGGEVVTLKNIEESSSLVIAEMPINVSSLLTLSSRNYLLEDNMVTWLLVKLNLSPISCN